MEDNPGDVTNDVEVKFKNMQLEAKVIRVELAKMTGEIYPSPNEKKKVTPGKSRPKTADEDEYGDDEFFEDEFEGGDAEEPEKDMDQAERLNLNVDPNITEPDEDAKKTWFLKEKIQLPKEEESPTTTRKMNISRQYSAVLGGSYEDEVNRIESELGFTNPNPAPVIKSSPSKKFNISRDPSKSSLDKSPSFNKANSDTTPQSKPTSTPVVTPAPAPVPIVKTPASVPSPTRFPVAASAPTPAPEAVPAAITTTTNISPVKTARSEKEYGDEDFDNYEDEFEGEKEETPKKIVPVTMTTPTKSYDAPSYSSSKDTNKSSNNATLEKKHTPTSVTEMNDYESPKVKQITPATKAAPQDEDDEYGNDDFDDYEQSFEAED